MLVASDYYPVLTFLVSLMFFAAVFATLGFHGARLFRALLLAAIPVMFLNANFIKYVIPPKIGLFMADVSLRLRK
jgi:hypothetical protein